MCFIGSMKTPTHVKQPGLPARSHPARSAFTLIELLVVITIIAILASIAVPVYTTMLMNAHQTKALQNATQISLALRLYANDHNGSYPSYTLQNGQPTTTTVANSNEAFAQLFPNYVNEEAIFWVPKSAFCSPNPPNEQKDNPPVDPPVLTLASGQNEWAYVLGLSDSSEPAVPMIADGFASAQSHTYAKDTSQKGGVWKGQKSIIVHADGSAVMAPVDPTSMMVLGPNGSNANGDIFTTANGDNGWLGTGNAVVNPD